jgi:hypothetical protein
VVENIEFGYIQYLIGMFKPFILLFLEKHANGNHYFSFCQILYYISTSESIVANNYFIALVLINLNVSQFGQRLVAYLPKKSI